MPAKERVRKQLHWLQIKGPIPVSRWGKDHISTIMYAECRAVDHHGTLPPNDPRMRKDAKTYPTRLKDADLFGHNDFDCLLDAEAAGFLTLKGGVVEFTDEGFTYVHGLRINRARTGRAVGA